MQVVVSSAASTNKAPIVSAGASQTITLPTRTATLAGTVADDGLPTGGTLIKTWTLVSGPASVSFGSPSSLTTLATFSAAGSYVLRLSAFDGQLTGSGDVVVTVLGEKAPNTAPSIVPGAPQTITYPASSTATLVATVTDDGLPVGGTLQTQWLQASGPAIATISGDVAAFTALGDYTFRVFAFDGELMSSALVKVSVVAPGPANTPPVVDAGLAQTIDMPAAAKLSASVRDDGLPVSGSLSMIWSKVSGPGGVTFTAPTAAATNASFDTAGTYVLRLTASDVVTSYLHESGMLAVQRRVGLVRTRRARPQGLVQLRQGRKQALRGQRWSQAGLRGVLTLRALHRSDRLDARRISASESGPECRQRRDTLIAGGRRICGLHGRPIVTGRAVRIGANPETAARETVPKLKNPGSAKAR